jgi:hypothetical protein
MTYVQSEEFESNLIRSAFVGMWLTRETAQYKAEKTNADRHGPIPRGLV